MPLWEWQEVQKVLRDEGGLKDVRLIRARLRLLWAEERGVILIALFVIFVSLGFRWAACQRNWLWYDEYYSAVFATTEDRSA